jgi:hypothetical protein
MRIIKPHLAQYFKDYWIKNRESIIEKRKTHRRQRRKEIIKFFGSSCKHCGFGDTRALQVDHINGGGNKEINLMKGGKYHLHLYREMKLRPKSFLKKYQLLCANCNLIKYVSRSQIVG